MISQQRTGPAPRPAIDRRGITAYILLTFGLTWAVDFYLLAQGVRFDQMPTWALLTVAGTMFFPALSAFIVRRWITKEGFGDSGLRFGSWRPYLVILLGVTLLFGLACTLSAALGVARFDPTLTSAMAQLQQLAATTGSTQPLPAPGAYLFGILVGSLTIAPVITALATFGEEFGWTGYLLPKLLPLGKWRAAVLYGLVWGLWHAPLIWGGYNYPGYPVLGILLMCVATIVMGLIQTALRLRYGSVFVTTWFHACINTQARGIWALLFVNIHPLFGGMLGAVGLAVMGLVGAWLLARAPEPA
jgi:membrane protease YdiL (CAAX protease family)